MPPPNSDPPKGSLLDDPAEDPAGGLPEDGDLPEDEESLGFFPSWGALYATVIVYTIALVLLLLILTRTLDHSPT